MIVPMKKISLITMGNQKEETLKTLRQLGSVHVEIREGCGEKLDQYKAQIDLLERALYTVGKDKKAQQKEITPAAALDLAKQIQALVEEKSACLSEWGSLCNEVERFKGWGEIDPKELSALSEKGVKILLCELPKQEYDALSPKIKTVRVCADKYTVKFLCLQDGTQEEDLPEGCQLSLPKESTADIRQKMKALTVRAAEIEKKIAFCVCYTEGFQNAKKDLQKKIELETYVTGMESEVVSDPVADPVSLAYFQGYIEAENLARLQQVAKEQAWGLLVEEPCVEDHVPTKLKNNKFVSLIYPIMDFLGTVPGYFEYDISGWFLTFILLFFGIIFGDGGYGLLICAVAAVPILKALFAKKTIAPAFLLMGLFGLATVLWGTLTCTWFGLSPQYLPRWLQALSIPVISNVYADQIWALPWTAEGVGLTTAQNVQIVCFTLALIQLSVAHVMGAVRNRGSVKLLGDVGSILQLFGIYYLVLSLVVHAEVFHFGLVLGGVPVGTLAIALIGVGFVMSFVFSNYEGNLGKSILSSLTNIVSVLLGVVNVFSDIVSYIRLWAVGLAGAAISATVNELAGPFFGNLLFSVIAVVLLVFGHGLNMILNVLSVIVHGIRLNTLEFSSHLDMSWSGHKFKPFENEN